MLFPFSEMAIQQLTFFSVDIEDLYYSILHDELFRSVTTCIEEDGEVDFCKATGMSLEGFLSLLEF